MPSKLISLYSNFAASLRRARRTECSFAHAHFRMAVWKNGRTEVEKYGRIRWKEGRIAGWKYAVAMEGWDGP